MGNFYHITVVPKPGVTADQVEKVMNLSLDWVHYHKDSWIVYSTSDIKKWNERLGPLVKPGGELLILNVDIDGRKGWTFPHVWEWLKKKRP